MSSSPEQTEQMHRELRRLLMDADAAGDGSHALELLRAFCFEHAVDLARIAIPWAVDQPLGNPGGGRYDADAEALRGKYRAREVLLWIGDGSRGSGLSHTSDLPSKSMVPDLFEKIARDVRKAQRAGLHP